MVEAVVFKLNRRENLSIVEVELVEVLKKKMLMPRLHLEMK